MEFGLCGGPEIAETAKKAGLGYFEWTVTSFLQPRNQGSAFNDTLTEVKGASIPCPVVNVFIPGDLKITGPDVNELVLEEYLQTALERAEKSGVEIIVFGSGGARRIPENFDRSAAEKQIIKFARQLTGMAAKRNVKIALEPLNRGECNILNSVSECADLVRKIGHPNFRLLVDAYHWALENESSKAIVDAGDLIIHAHIATPANRLVPGAEPYDFSVFFEALRSAGYKGRLSIEARLDQSRIEVELRDAVTLMRKYA